MPKAALVHTKNDTHFPDTSVIIRDPHLVFKILDNKKNILILAMKVLEELDGKKKADDISKDVMEAIRNIERVQLSHPDRVVFYKEADWTGLGFDDRGKADHKIISTINHAVKNLDVCKNSHEIIIYSNDIYFRTVAKEVFRSKKRVKVINHEPDRTDMLRYSPPKKFYIDDKLKNRNSDYPIPGGENIIENEGVLIVNKSGNIRMALRKNNVLKLIPDDISAFGIKPLPFNGDDNNYVQTIAMAQLLDPNIALNVFIGPAGSGKTLIALAAALSLRDKCKQILVTRPMVAMGDKDTMGFLPGDIKEKMDPWLAPIWQNLEVIKENPGNKAKIESMLNVKKITIQPLNYIRGATLLERILIIDEAQNLNPHQMKTIVTRAGARTKIILVGDLTQIDKVHMTDPTMSGLNYVANRMKDHPLTALTLSEGSVRSELTSLALERL